VCSGSGIAFDVLRLAGAAYRCTSAHRCFEGRALVDVTIEAHLHNEERLLAGLPEKRRTELAALLRELLLTLDPGGDAGQVPAG
jgi:hypothetical protein